MAGGKVILCTALLMLIGLGGAFGQSNSTKEAAKETPVTEPPTSAIPESEEAELVTEQFNATRVLNALRTELARRRTERQQQLQQRTQERREQIMRSLESLSERKREYELNRQMALQTAEALREIRRLEMEARRVGRLPVRERDRYNRARLEQLAEETPEEENEIGDSADGVDEDAAGMPELASGGVQRVRNLLLIEEANGSLRLIDLDTEEGQQFALEAVQTEAEPTGEPATGEAVQAEQTEQAGQAEQADQAEVAKRKLKIGQI